MRESSEIKIANRLLRHCSFLYPMSYHVRQVLWMTCLCTLQVTDDNRPFSLASLIVLELGCQDSLFGNENLSTGKKNAHIAGLQTFQKNKIFLISLAGIGNCSSG